MQGMIYTCAWTKQKLLKVSEKLHTSWGGWAMEVLGGKVLASKLQGPECDPQRACVKVGHVMGACNPSAGKVATGGCLEFASQLV